MKWQLRSSLQQSVPGSLLRSPPSSWARWAPIVAGAVFGVALLYVIAQWSRGQVQEQDVLRIAGTFAAVLVAVLAVHTFVATCGMPTRRADTSLTPCPWAEVSDASTLQDSLRELCGTPNLIVGEWNVTRQAYLDWQQQVVPDGVPLVRYLDGPVCAPDWQVPQRTVVLDVTPRLLGAVRSLASQRSAWSRHLHDGSQQHLVHASLRLRLIEEQIRLEGCPPEPSALAAVRILLEDCAEDLQQLTHTHSPPELRHHTTLEALRIVAQRCAVPTEIEVEGSAHPLLCTLSRAQSEALYYVASEAVTNAVKHASPTRICLSLRGEDRRVPPELRLIVWNDGTPYNPDQQGSSGVGLDNMRRYAAECGGIFTIESIEGHGTELEFCMPVRHS